MLVIFINITGCYKKNIFCWNISYEFGNENKKKKKENEIQFYNFREYSAKGENQIKRFYFDFGILINYSIENIKLSFTST